MVHPVGQRIKQADFGCKLLEETMRFKAFVLIGLAVLAGASVYVDTTTASAMLLALGAAAVAFVLRAFATKRS